jgi:putative chitobiose transport system permease protein
VIGLYRIVRVLLDVVPRRRHQFFEYGRVDRSCCAASSSGVPAELADAARVDGLGWWGVFWRIHLPLSKPALIGGPDPVRLPMAGVPVAAVDRAGSADEGRSGRDRPVRRQQGVDFGATFAGVTMTALVPLLVLLFFQRYFTQSVTASGLKG